MRAKWLVRLLSVAILASVLTAVSPLREAAADRAAARYVYTDPATGKVFFNVYLDSGPIVVYRTADGEWMRLPDFVDTVWPDSGSGCLRASAFPPQGEMYGGGFCYDAAADELVHTAAFESSPSGKWGLKTVIYYRPHVPPEQQPAIHYGSFATLKQAILFLRDNTTGEIRQLVTGDRTLVYYWLKDGTLLLQRFSETDRQNELVRIHPATGETKRVLLGSLRGYNAERDWLLYVLNEPSRTLRILDIATGKSRVAAEDEIRLFYPESDAPKPEEPSFPDDLDIGALPVADTGLRQEFVAALTLDGREAKLPFAFVGLDGETYVPVRALIESGWTMRQVPLDNGYEFALRSDRGELKLNRTNSMSLNERLYVPIRLIASLGHVAELKWMR